MLELNPDGTGMRVYASGLRNPVGLAVHPESRELWAAVNERDMLGDELVPDYLTAVKEGAFYGWPYAYFGPIEDPRKKGERPDLVAKTIPPDFSLGAHVAPLGLAFYSGALVPGAVSQRCVRRAARVLEPVAVLRVQRRLRAVPAGPAVRRR